MKTLRKLTMKTFLNVAAIVLLALGLIIIVSELAYWISSIGFYVFSLGLSLLVGLGAWEIYERSK